MIRVFRPCAITVVVTVLIAVAQAEAKGNNDHGHGKGHGRQSHEDAAEKVQGSLNAAHASPTARAHAAPNSQVGKIASYESAVQDGDIAAAAASLAEAANKAIVEPVVHALNELLDIDTAPVESGGTVHDIEADVAAEAAAAQSEK